MTDRPPNAGRSFILRYYDRRRDTLTSAPREVGPTGLFTELARAALPEFACWVGVVDRLTNTEFSLCRIDHAHSMSACAQCWATGLDIDPVMAKVITSGESFRWPDEGHGPRAMISQLTSDDRPVGAVLIARDSPYDVEELEVIHDVVTALGVDLERLRLRHESKVALRASQRVASRLHQLISASLALGSVTDEAAIVQSLSRSARSVFDADHMILALGDSGNMFVGSTLRGRAPKLLDSAGAHENHLPELREQATEPWLHDDWLCAPILDSQRRPRGIVAARRASASDFSAEDREMAMLVGQLAATSLEALELNRKIHDNETRLRILVDAAPIAIVESDGTGRVRWWNRSASRLLRWPNYSSDDVERVDWPDDVHEVLTALWSDILHGGHRSYQEFSADVGGRVRLVAGSVAVLPSIDDAPNILTLLDDITDQSELREEVRHAHRMELRGQVASSVAHDFNNLITLILGYAELLARHVVGDEKSEALVDEIQATSSRASRLTSQLQSIGRTAVTTPVSVDITAMLLGNAEVLERIMGPKVTLTFSLSESGPQVIVDADLFEQMVLNLCINARDAMPDGGTLALRTEICELTADSPTGPIGLSGPHVALSISDTGIGMDETTRLRCFEPLFTTKGPFQGTGLGLASARRLVEESGGVIVCESLLGVGTTFTVWLPTIEHPRQTSHVDNETDDEVATSRRRRDVTSGTVLLCEDDVALRHLALRSLQRNGLTVLEAVSGEDALEVIDRFNGTIDALVSDIILPEMTGQELAERLQRAQPNLKVVLMSGTASSEAIGGLLAGSALFIAKPFRPSELIDGVLGLLRHRTPTVS